MTDLGQLANAIVARDVRLVSGVVGSGATLELADALERRGVGFVRTQSEATAAVFAGVSGHLSGRPGIALSIKGPGVASMLPGLAICHFEEFPMVAISEAYGADAPSSRAHKRLDHAAATAPFVKDARVHDEASTEFAALCRHAVEEPPGPTLLQLAGPSAALATPSPEPPAAVMSGDVGRALDLIERAARPIVIAGPAAARAGCSDRLGSLAVPVFSTASAKGIIDEHSDASAGIFTGVGLDLTPEARLLGSADLVVAIGVQPADLLATRRPAASSVALVAGAPDPGFEDFEHDVVLPLDQNFRTCLEPLARKSWGLDALASAKQELRRKLLSTKFLPAHAFAALQEADGPALRLVLDTGYFCTIAEHLWCARSFGQCLLAGRSRYMGTGIPMGLGAALHDQKPTFIAVGDGGIGPFFGELKIAVERSLPVLVILMSDGRYGSVATRALADGLTQRPLTIGAPSWLAAMEGLGFASLRADRETEFRDALSAWVAKPCPTYVEIGFDPDAYERMTAGIR